MSKSMISRSKSKSPFACLHEVLQPLRLDRSNPIAYLVESIQQDRRITGLLSGRLNVEVNEILDAAKESIRTGKPVAMPKD